MIIVGYALSGAYTELAAVDVLSEMSGYQSSIYFVMSNLAYVALIVGLLSLVITFAKPDGGGGDSFM